MISIYTQIAQGEAWIAKYRDRLPVFACILGFTETGLIPGISAAGKTPEDRKYTACADAEFLYYGAEHQAKYPLPPLAAGASPVLISRAVVEALKTPVYLFNAGLPYTPAVPSIDLGGFPARCLSQGNAMELATVKHLLEQGLLWGTKLAANQDGYLVLGECVVGGTTTALAILTGLGIPAEGKVNSSHPICNHDQKSALVLAGLEKMRQRGTNYQLPITNPQSKVDPLKLIAAVGDPMQVVVAGMAIAASRSCGVLLAGGTQMLAVYALMNAIAQAYNLSWQPKEVVVGTTRWVAEDPTGGTVELALSLGQQDIMKGGETPPLLATQLNFTDSCYPQLQAYEQGFVKEGMGAGGAAIAAHLSLDWQQNQLLEAIEKQLERLSRFNQQ
ncbi:MULTISPECIES: nicotinate mononucleotide-dependent phosphoribosyltransferase CobT [unclassified Tolypothrix]|uniref:nicotinate mononucleotide-dependent phosphoribosyltransferase CobT n=1 Tax=unclassified Tolypothrix TaxID=2649714 RepID=UPI0005EAC338|nr:MULTISPECIES: TIGR00303 family protein [unclassified Tolypothrix]BAY88193.1 nicotinate-nucleotide-dimethylbenzimidazole phosphoribosyltransferase [Microchaete diplosiphon NIES-3275]EKF02056.1 TIGR00303 protein [Tolypothrix sp. PCC 7601]MBE9085648.1 TIGR00303 family protein [Tolypothrix sp. LEGE 11397]UYD28896.1 TIGR00303 family protein [Tolypothrix sp. PCC 7712]UYD35192.1 TIGR00303 family protein [Tolypothrix sp. PCC 7601]